MELLFRPNLLLELINASPSTAFLVRVGANLHDQEVSLLECACLPFDVAHGGDYHATGLCPYIGILTTISIVVLILGESQLENTGDLGQLVL